jgi:hypothetical protein
MDTKEVGYVDVDWIHVVQDKDQCLALMSMVINRFSPKLF